ncbi:hypothetical protein HNR60_002120 [Rhodopseudomonas rhenobacensis]|uniref:TadE-like domain-containing protein n=1 Tax=Rhodopseudomonas rhenobacensis TaxID=87461 RepID=A0A7W7Z3M1_9BRAD|nr:TadE/TadG family type IV pilus assembly protein [Rhodopseudomonas rhenobacensis]MBB5047366.1 hypothetical protein [Rhodopseudomonas rhenobacensis]
MPGFRCLQAVTLNALRGFGRNRRGATAVEFALVAPFFFGLLFAIIEVGLVFFAGQLLETGTQDSARAFLTQTNPALASDFKQLVCDRVKMLLNCDDLRVDVQSFAPGATIDIKNPIDSKTGAFVDSFVYTLPPSANSNYTIVVRSFYPWPLFVTKLGFDMSNIGRGTANSKHLLAATAALRPQ